MNSTKIEAPAYRSYRDMVQLVDIHGNPVPDCERHTPTCPREPLPADSWPAWTDLVTVGLLGRDFEHHIGGAKLADCYRSIMERADGEPDMPPDPDLSGEDDDTGEFPAVVVPDEDGPDAPDDPAYYGPTRLQALGLMPISGGSPVDEEPYPLPTPADLAEYDEWSRGLDDCGDFPRVKGPDDRRRDMADVREFYRTHPEA